MCNFKSGVILKNRVVLAPEGNESHSDLLESLGIEDTHMNQCHLLKEDLCIIRRDLLFYP